MSKLRLCMMVVFALVSAVGTAPGAMVDFRPALIPQQGEPLAVPLAIVPSVPTTADTISFSAPLDGEVHSNHWAAAADLLGSPVLDVDEVNRVINIRFDGVFSDIYPAQWDPVLGAWGEFGPLAAGDWILYNSHSGSLAFTVVPEPASLLLLSACLAGILPYRWRRCR